MRLSSSDDSLLRRDINERTKSFKHNSDLESLTAELIGYLKPVEFSIESNFNMPSMPPLFIIGNPRSGTTMLLQFLALSKAFSYPSNFLARFYFAPYIGAKLQELLTNPHYNYKNELTFSGDVQAMSSDLGKTVGTLAPNEFNFFWRRFLPKYDPQYLSPEECNDVDINGLRKGIAAIESVFAKPFTSKAINIQYNLDILYSAFPNSIILYIHRNPLYIMQSILLSRERLYNNRELWWSVKPKEFEHLRKLDIYHQIAGQVYFTDKSIIKDLSEVSTQNKMIVDYETLCENPESVKNKIIAQYARFGIELDFESVSKKYFQLSNTKRLKDQEIDALMGAYSDFESGNISFS